MANQKISDMTSATTPLGGTELVEIIQGGTNKKTTAQDIADLGGGGGAWGSITGTLSDQTDLQAALDAKENEAFTHNTQTGNYVLVLTDKDSTLVEMNVGSANTVTVPLNSSVAFPIGTKIPIVQYGAGLTSVVATGGVTIRNSGGTLDSPGQYAPMVLEKRGTDEWYLWNGTPGGGTVESVTGDGVDNTDPANPVLTFPIASEITNTPSGSISATDVQGAIDELASEKLATGTAYLLASGGTASASNTFTANTSTWFNWGGTWTAAANNDYHHTFGGSFTSRNTASDNIFGYRFTPSLVVNAGNPINQNLIAVDVSPTFSNTGVSGTLAIGLRVNVANFALQGAGGVPLLLRGSTAAANTIVGTSNTGSRFWVMSSSAFLFGALSTDDPSTALSTGLQVAPANITTNNQGYLYLFAGTVTATSGTATGANFRMSVAASSGSATANTVRIQTAGGNSSTATTNVNGLYLENIANNMNIGGSYNDITIGTNFIQNASSSVPYTGIKFNHTINQTNTGAGTIRGIDYNPTETAILGSHYFMTNRSTTAMSGLGVASPTAMLHLAAVTTARASLCINPGATTTAPSSPVSGDIWHEGTGNRLMFRQGGTSTEVIATSSVNTVSATAPNRTLTVLLNNTTYYIHAKTTND